MLVRRRVRGHGRAIGGIVGSEPFRFPGRLSIGGGIGGERVFAVKMCSEGGGEEVEELLGLARGKRELGVDLGRELIKDALVGGLHFQNAWAACRLERRAVCRGLGLRQLEEETWGDGGVTGID